MTPRVGGEECHHGRLYGTHVATQQPGLKPGGLCHLGAPAGARVPWYRNFENVEQLKQAIVLEWRALSQRTSEVHWWQYQQWRRRLQGVVQENGGHIEHKFN